MSGSSRDHAPWPQRSLKRCHRSSHELLRRLLRGRDRAMRRRLAAHDRYWWDVSVTYVDYVVDTLQRWQENPRRRRVQLEHFDEWRRDEDAYYRERKAAQAALAAIPFCTCEHDADMEAGPKERTAEPELGTVG